VKDIREQQRRDAILVLAKSSLEAEPRLMVPFDDVLMLKIYIQQLEQEIKELKGLDKRVD